MATRRSRTAARRTLARSAAATQKARKAREEGSTSTTRGRIGLLYGLTGLFGVVVVGLLLARPRPLRAQEEGPHVSLMATGTNAGVDPLDIALQTGNAAKPGQYTGVTVLRLTTSQAKAHHAHFKVMLDENGDAPQVVVGQEWLQQATVPDDDAGNFVLVVVVDDHEREIRHDATVVALVERLCSRLKVDASRVNWS